MFWTILEKTYQHVLISLIALLIALCIALPLGFALSRSKNQKLSLFIVRSTSLIQTMPGLAMLALIVVTLAFIRQIIPIPSTGILPGVIALSLICHLTHPHQHIHRHHPGEPHDDRCSYRPWDDQRANTFPSADAPLDPHDHGRDSDCRGMDDWNVHAS